MRVVDIFINWGYIRNITAIACLYVTVVSSGFAAAANNSNQKIVLKGQITLEKSDKHVPIGYSLVDKKSYPIEIYLENFNNTKKRSLHIANRFANNMRASHWHILCDERGNPKKYEDQRCWPGFLCKEATPGNSMYYLVESHGMVEHSVTNGNLNIILHPSKEYNPHNFDEAEWRKNSIVLKLPLNKVQEVITDSSSSSTGSSSQDMISDTSDSSGTNGIFDSEGNLIIRALREKQEVPCLVVSQEVNDKFFTLQKMVEIKIEKVEKYGVYGCRREHKLTSSMVEELSAIKPNIMTSGIPSSMLPILSILFRTSLEEPEDDSLADDEYSSYNSPDDESSSTRPKKKAKVNGNYISYINNLDIDDRIKEKFRGVANRLKHLSPHQSEYDTQKSYLDYVLDLPWNNEADIPYDDEDFMEQVTDQLNTDHYGLLSVKRRILQYLAVKTFRASKKISAAGRQPILCFVGPPGIGKTSIAQSIAKALGTPFERIALGGVDDEAIIRGHSRTYIGSKAGRIMDAVRSTGVSNSVIVLDEIDKLGHSRGGNPADALLEVLDPEQNDKYVDHYVDAPFDLSKVFWICTANDLGGIPRALRDRMHVIELDGYTQEEKFRIGKDHLLPKTMSEIGLDETEVGFSDEALKSIIEFYTREPGVRNLKREIYNALSQATDEILRGAVKPINIDDSKLHEYLLAPRYTKEAIDTRERVPGLAIGLYYSVVGGGVLFIEADYIETDSDFKLTLTGQLGDVMKESAQIACRHVRVNHEYYGVDPKKLEKGSMHIHVPDGATPKDGPSAGTAIFTTIVSLLTGKTVKEKLGMTGEITLHGEVEKIGGVKQKVTGAYVAGVRELVLPKDNEKEYREEVAPDIQSVMKAHFVRTAKEVFAIALDHDEPMTDGNEGVELDMNPVYESEIEVEDCPEDAKIQIESTPMITNETLKKAIRKVRSNRKKDNDEE